MKICDIHIHTADWGLWLQASKYVVWGLLAAALNDLCVVTQGLCYLLSA